MKIPWWKMLLSYFYPLILLKKKSTISGELELGLQDGKLVIDAENVNYSYGKLHQLFRNVIKRLSLAENRQYNVLILGFGGGSIAQILQVENNLNCKIVGVELDQSIIALWNAYFKKQKTNNIQLIQVDALDFMSINQRKFDLIFVDVFIDSAVPASFLTEEFLNLLYRSLEKNGHLLMNTILEEDIQILNSKWQKVFSDKGKNEELRLQDLNTVKWFLKD